MTGRRGWNLMLGPVKVVFAFRLTPFFRDFGVLEDKLDLATSVDYIPLVVEGSIKFLIVVIREWVIIQSY